MRSLMNQLPRYWMDGAMRSLEGLRNGLTEPFPHRGDPPPLTPYTVIATEGKMRLRYYQAAPQERRDAVLIVYPLIKRPFILDLVPGKSVIQSLLSQGTDVYLTDWIPPTRVDSWRGFDAYVNGDVATAVQLVGAHAGVEQVSILGYCFGALLASMYTALHPQTVDRLITLTLPFDFQTHDVPLFGLMGKMRPETLDLIPATYGNCPASLVKSAFTAMSPVHHGIDKYIGLYRNEEKEGYAEFFDLFERWMNSDVALAGQIFREITQQIFQQNLLSQTRMRVGGTTVDMRQITCPVLNIIGEHDDVVHPHASESFAASVGSSDTTTLTFPSGHVGVVVSAGAHKKLWPQVGAWLEERATQIAHGAAWGPTHQSH
ncbi:MAG: alpha/beta fold hydrolase [Deltaproteobacteria bacterium]|nr:alpha/beta fold hydrolase [Deltaproteobacteria bacterium]